MNDEHDAKLLEEKTQKWLRYYMSKTNKCDWVAWPEELYHYARNAARAELKEEREREAKKPRDLP